MSQTLGNAAAPISVNIVPGSAPSAPPVPTAIAFNAQTQALVTTYSDGTQLMLAGLLPALAQALGGASLAVLDANGALILGGKSRLGVSAAGNLAVVTPLPSVSAGYTPVAGSGELYRTATGGVQEA